MKKISLNSMKASKLLSDLEFHEPLILLDKSKIKKILNTKSMKLEVYKEVDSTNDQVKKIYDPKKKITVCLAETQTQGRGRFQRHWHSPFAQNIYISLLYPFDKNISELAGLSLVVGLAICTMLESCCELAKPLLVKWPNDVMYEGQKLAGSLIEVQAQTHDACQVIIGIGLNVNMQLDPSKKIKQAWTSLKECTNQFYDRNILTASLLDHVAEYLDRFSQLGLKFFLNEWRTRDHLFNKPIHLKSHHKELRGIGQGISEYGHLLIKLNDNSIRAFSAGDTTLLK
ncbi:MAG: biotin--[acetyl-CoA-carboxylase] ligase [Gammaproteobacteria bacterium]|nr:biotin--[acetyl-CoA-carboxylase] ligase [Gammaproteobacteria bacterium]